MSNILKSKGMTGASMFKTSFTGQLSDLGANEPLVKTSDMRQVFLESYGVEMEFPGFYYYDAKFVPKADSHNYIVVLAWHIVPQGKNKMV